MVSEVDSAERPIRTSVWLEGRSPGRGGRSNRGDDGTAHPSGLDRDRITAVSVRLLDAEGHAKFSMRRLAAELGVTAMSLYWYVDTKDYLLELALDSVFDEVRVPDASTDDETADAATDDATDWRVQLRDLAVGYRALLVRHPWVSPLIGKYLNIGPRSMAFSAAVQAVIRRTGLPPHREQGGIAAVFQFVYGFGTVEGHFVQRCADAGLSQEAYFRRAMGAIGDQPRLAGAFADMEGARGADGGASVEVMRDQDFDFALELLVAGIDAMCAREPHEPRAAS
ncbi:TetR/AcrR family transcriptional regulator [Streptomyces sp. NPDC088554]|uniref:TetR/AcrR family transcriptional regulator n=1 Tax=Streptomyces sp. NPDC088554 TaxID=3365865 RepID=UPI003813C737